MTAGLEAANVSVELAGRPVLRNVSFRVPPGKVTALIAPSGAGKSTLLRTFVRLVEPDEGSVALHGDDVMTLDARRLRCRVGLVAQAPVMLPGTVADNLRHGVPELPPAGLEEALAAASLNLSFANRRADELSGGERARVALARALTRGPELLLLDEPTAALDAPNAAQIGATLKRLTDEGLGICLATHDLPFAERWADIQEHPL